MEEDHFGRKACKDDEQGAAAAMKPTRSFRYEDYSTRRVFLRSYPLQWDWSPEPDAKQGMGGAAEATGNTKDDAEERCGGRGWWTRRQVVVAVVEWGEDKLLLLRRAKKRLALYLLGCSYGHGRPAPALPFRSGGGSCTAAMLASR